MIRQWFERRRISSSEEILDEMLGELADLNRSYRHIYGLRNSLTPFIRRFPHLEKVRHSDVVEYLREISQRVGPRRRDNILAAIVQYSRFARRHDHLPEDRRSAAEKVWRIKPSHDIETWTPPEAALILEYVSRDWLPSVALGLFAGLRPSEILRLDWNAIKFDEGEIRVSARVARKIRISRVVPIQPNLAAWLEPYRDRVGPLYPGNFKTNENAHSREMARIRRLTGLPRKDNALRHSYGSYRLAVIKNRPQLAEEMGNSPRMIRENYNDPKSEREGAAYFALAPAIFENVVPMPLALEFR